MIAEVDDDDGNLPANCRPLECARRCRSHRVVAACHSPRSAVQRCTLPDVGGPSVADGRFPLYRE
ncbi:hypothetical protein GGR60_000591 [Xanthomonas arboricola]|nr:hypothetical protein [Xanthomonas euroxanthea]